MKLKWMALIICLVLGTQCARPANLLKLGQVDSFVGNSCWFEPSAPLGVNGSFTLPGVTGTGSVQSTMFYAARPPGPFPLPTGPIYTYALDLSQMSVPSGHCVKLAMYFGSPSSLCSGNQVLVLTNATSVPLLAATQSLSTIYFTYGAGGSTCLQPGQTGASFALLTQQSPTTSYVTVIDDYVDPASGLPIHYTTKVTALVPDIPPLSVIALPPFFQGVVKGTSGPATNGQYDITMQLLDAPSNGIPVSETITSTVNVVNGLLNVPMDFDPSAFFGQRRWLSLAVQLREAANQPPSLIPALPISPTPQALYAYTAGTVGRISPGQAVTSLNGLTDAVTLEAGSGIVISGNGNTLTIAALPGGPSDRNLKTDFAVINPAEVLARLEMLPVQSWRFINEHPAIRHVGPMAQDFMNAFHLGNDDKLIGYLDEGGVALAAIQGLNQKVELKNAEITELKRELEKLKQVVDKLANAKD